MIQLKAIVTTSRLVSTRNGMFRVERNELVGPLAVVVWSLRGLMGLTGAVLIIVVSALVSEEHKLTAALVGIGLVDFMFLTMVPWRTFATKLLGRRIPCIAGTSTVPGEITSIIPMDD